METNRDIVQRWLRTQEQRLGHETSAYADRLRALLPELVRVLSQEPEVCRIWLFGSLAWGTVHSQSDIDLAVEGLPARRLFAAQGELLLTSPTSVDLLRLEEAPAELAARVRSEGQLLWAQEGA